MATEVCTVGTQDEFKLIVGNAGFACVVQLASNNVAG